MKIKAVTWLIVQEAMKAVAKYVRKPKCVRDGIIKVKNKKQYE